MALTNALDNMHLCLVNCDEISEIDKEMIFFNNLRSAAIPIDQLKEICLDLGFRKICQSPNYSPRTIENALKKAFISMVEKKKSSYVYEVMYLFDHPNDIWKDEINNRLKPSDRYLLYVMASFGYASILEAKLRAAFGEFIKNQHDIDKSKNHFDSSLCKINNEFVKKEVLPFFRPSSYFSFLNPSVYEVVREEVFEGDNETILDNLRNSAIFFEQYLALNPEYCKSHDFAEKMKTGAILDMKSASHQMTYVYFEKLNDGFEELYANEDVLIRVFENGIYKNSFKENDKLAVSFIKHLKGMSSSSKFVRMLFSSEDFFKKVIDPFDDSMKIEIYKAVLNLAGSQEEKGQFQEREHFSLADTISSLLNDKAYEEMALDGESLLYDYGVEADDKEKASETIFSNKWEEKFSDFQRKNPELSFVDSLAVEADPGSHDIVGALFPDEDEPFDFDGKEADQDLDKAKELFEDYYKEQIGKIK